MSLYSSKISSVIPTKQRHKAKSEERCMSVNQRQSSLTEESHPSEPLSARQSYKRQPFTVGDSDPLKSSFNFTPS